MPEVIRRDYFEMEVSERTKFGKKFKEFWLHPKQCFICRKESLDKFYLVTALRTGHNEPITCENWAVCRDCSKSWVKSMEKMMSIREKRLKKEAKKKS